MTGLVGMFVARDAGGNGTTPVGARQALAGLLAKNADGTVKVGVLADGQGPVVTGAAGMSYSVRKHVAVTKVSEANGPVLVPNDGTLSLTTDPAPGSNSRIDVIWARQHHVTGDGGSDTDVTPEYGVTKGASNASPSKPAIPTGATELASVPVPSGTTATSGLTFTQGAMTTTVAPLPVGRGSSGLLNRGALYPNSSTNNIASWTPTTPQRGGGSLASVTANINAYAGTIGTASLQDATHQLQVQLAGGAWVDVDSALVTNASVAFMPLGASLSGWVSVQAAGALAFRVMTTVAGGGPNLAVGGVNISATFF